MAVIPREAPRFVGEGNARNVELHARAIPPQSLDIEHVVGPVVQRRPGKCTEYIAE
jgi:hypothetical protein